MKPYEEIDAVNWSSLAPLQTCPKLYAWRKDHPRKASDAMNLGTAVHAKVLQAEHFANQWVTKPAGLNMTTLAGKSWAKEQGEKAILPSEKAAIVEACAQAVNANPEARRILESAPIREEVITWLDVYTGVACKGRVDMIGDSVLGELKTTRSIDIFGREARRYGYHGQTAFYRDGAVESRRLLPSAPVEIIAVETSEPFDCIVFHVRPDVLAEGRRLYRRLIGTLLECQRTGLWPGRAVSMDLELPTWGSEDEDDDEEEVIS